MGCGTSFVKYVLFFFNLLVSLIGIAMVALGIIVIMKWKILKEIQSYNITIAPWVFIVIGAIIFIIAFFGCCGAIRESHCMIVTYAIFLLFIIIIQVILAVLLFVYGTDLRTGLQTGVGKFYETAKTDQQVAVLFHNLEEQLECCGGTGPGNYPLTSQVLNLPKSCCPHSDSPICSTLNASHTGCIEKVGEIFTTYSKPIAGVAIGVACIEVIGVIFALCLANSIRNLDRRSRY